MGERLISEDERRRIREHRLDDSVVRMMLAGYLHQELRNVHGVHVPAAALKDAIGEYVLAIGEHMDEAEFLVAAGVRPRGWSA